MYFQSIKFEMQQSKILSTVLIRKVSKAFLICMTLTLPAPCIFESGIKIKINLNFYFHISLWCLEEFYEGLRGFHKTF